MPDTPSTVRCRPPCSRPEHPAKVKLAQPAMPGEALQRQGFGQMLLDVVPHPRLEAGRPRPAAAQPGQLAEQALENGVPRPQRLRTRFMPIHIQPVGHLAHPAVVVLHPQGPCRCLRTEERKEAGFRRLGRIAGFLMHATGVVQQQVAGAGLDILPGHAQSQATAQHHDHLVERMGVRPDLPAGIRPHPADVQESGVSRRNSNHAQVFATPDIPRKPAPRYAREVPLYFLTTDCTDDTDGSGPRHL